MEGKVPKRNCNPPLLTVFTSQHVPSVPEEYGFLMIYHRNKLQLVDLGGSWWVLLSGQWLLVVVNMSIILGLHIQAGKLPGHIRVSVFPSCKMFSLFQVSNPWVSLRSKHVLKDVYGNDICKIKKKLLAFRCVV
eukprot:sb/3474792/